MIDERAMRREELANALTHGLGAVASAVAGAVLIGLAAEAGGARHLASAVVYSASLVLLYLASTLYHAARREGARRRLQVLDHSAIYVLIAGTYTPFTLVSLRGTLGWTLFGVVWALAAAGVVFKLFFTGRLPRLSTALYLGMGWLALAAIRPLAEVVSPATLAWMVAGGVAYTVGTAFYHSKRLPFAHAIWHLFVLAGSTCHFVAVLTQIAAPAA